MTDDIRKFALSAVSTDGLADKRQVLVRISSEGVDRQGDIVVQAGLDTRSFMGTGGTVLWGHDPDQPIARCVSIERVGQETRALAQFPEHGVSGKADEIYGLIKAAIVSSASIGFRALEREPIDPKDPWNGQRYLKTELMEFSFVSVPANADATIIARAHAKKADEKAAETWTVGASRTLPLGADDAWDGAAAEKAIFDLCKFDGDKPDTKTARKAFLAYDSARPKERGSYKMPFADVVDGRLTAMPAALRAAASRLSQADISAAAETKARAIIDHYEAKMSDDKAALPPELKTLIAGDAEAERDPIAFVRSLIEAHKGGRVLSAANFEHVQGLTKCLSMMAECHEKALDSHGQTAEQLQAFVDQLDAASGHAKALMKSARKPKPKDDPDAGDDGADDGGDDDSGDDVELAAAVALRKRQAEIAEREF